MTMLFTTAGQTSPLPQVKNKLIKAALLDKLITKKKHKSLLKNSFFIVVCSVKCTTQLNLTTTVRTTRHITDSNIIDTHNNTLRMARNCRWQWGSDCCETRKYLCLNETWHEKNHLFECGILGFLKVKIYKCWLVCKNMKLLYIGIIKK